MAIELLLQKDRIRHTPQHDLESLFFVLIYLCTNLSGPGLIWTKAELQQHSTIPLSAWFTSSSSLHQLGTNKAGVLCFFEDNILRRFSPYFEELKPCINNIFKAIYGNHRPGTPSDVTHDQIIQIFTQALDSLAPEPVLPNNFCPLLVSSPSCTRKHSLGLHDNNLHNFNRKKLKSSSIETIDRSSSSIPEAAPWIELSGYNISTCSRGSRRSRGFAYMR